jgi:ATP-binding cassette subfamily F protein uup
MAILISVQKLEKSFGARTLFRGLSFGIETGNRIGLIGPNGAGKSTLMKIIANQMDADQGEVVRARGLRLGFLEQSPEFREGITVFEAVAEGLADPEDYGPVYEWLAKLELTEGDRSPDQMVSDLSGGWRKRVALARELVKNPDLLLLDEPTNHLDLESILWLEKFLQEAPFATLTITHDRLFLQRVSNRIFDLDKRNPDGLLVIQGDYTDYLEAKELLINSLQRHEEVVKNTLRRETEWLRRGAKARQTKQKARIERAGDLKDEAEDLKERNQMRTANIDFQSAERHPQKLIEAKGISKSYDGRKLFGPIDLLVTPKTRLGLLGSNGSGKTTLIRTLLGQEAPDTGTVRQADRLQAAYFAQYRDELDPDLSLLRTICGDGDYVNFRGTSVFNRSYLSRFLFRTDQMDLPVGKLSGGEKARLRVAQLMLEKANVLILDEPTNDLDMATLDVLEESLRDFDGAVILVTHDRYFLDQVANEILAFSPGKNSPTGLERFADIAQWETWVEQGSKALNSVKISETAEAPAPAATSVGTKPTAAAGKSKKKLSYKDQRELDGIEEVILGKEAQLTHWQAESLKPEHASNSKKLIEVSSEIAGLEKEIERLYARWAELEN